MVIHHVRILDVVALEAMFTTRTPTGWETPAWLKLMRATTQLTADDRAMMAAETTEAMRMHYEKQGEEPGDWADGERYLRDEASDAELLAEHEKWLSIPL